VGYTFFKNSLLLLNSKYWQEVKMKKWEFP
jgi:hypothetical protein